MKTLTAVDRWADTGPGFNRHAAEVVYKAMTAMDDDSALVYGRILVAGAVNYDLISHRDELAKAAGDQARQRAETLRAHYSREAVAKARRGQDNTEEIAILVQIEKAFNYTPEERRRYVSAQARQHGRFVQMHHQIDTDPSSPPADQTRAEKQGIPSNTLLSGKDLSHYQQAYGQIQDLLAPFHSEHLNPLLHLQVVGRNGKERTVQAPVQATEKDVKTDFSASIKPGDRILTAAVSVTPERGRADTAAFDALAAAGAPRLGGYVGHAVNEGVLNSEKVRELNTKRGARQENENFSAAGRAFGRLERGSEILRTSMGPAAPPQLQYALAVANHVGQFGPEAQKVIGPAADRAAYRYRGTERAPDPVLQTAFGKIRQVRFRGLNPRDVAVGGIDDPKEGWDPGPVLNYFQDRLPNPDLNELQRRSGVIPPSEGIVITANGDVAHQSIGYADDWYLPFNLRHLSALKGGEYIRTRTFGGPTTEDIYTGLVSGAKSMTIVSHNGVYTVDFDRNLRGGRRFNDKASRMVARYGQLLDALRSEQVGRGSISPSRMEELRETAREYDPDESSEAFTHRLRELQTKEKARPTLSQQEQLEAAANWVGEQAADTLDNSGNALRSDEYVTRLVNAQAKTAWQANVATARQMGVDPAFKVEAFQEQIWAGLQTGTPLEQIGAIADLAGKRSSFDRAMKQADQANRDRVRSLRLDGEGYNDALNALHEQFPYYIAKPVYHPWRASQGVGPNRTLERAVDSGYVAPRFNRPEKAEGGYFNESVTGAGKITAQSTRYQNFRVGQGKLVPVPKEQTAEEVRNKAAGRHAGTAGAVTDKDLQRAADLDMLTEVLAQTSFASGAEFNVGGKVVDASGLNIRAEAKLDTFPHAAIKQVFGAVDRADLEALPHDDLHRLMLDLAAVATGPKKAFSLKQVVLDRVRTGGRVAPPEAPPASLGELLSELDKDHVFPGGGAAYDPARPASVAEIERAYGAETSIQNLVSAGELLPVDTPTGTPDPFDTAARALRSKLEDANRKHIRLRSVGGQPDLAAQQADMRTAGALARAMQLRRRWVDADKNRPPAPPTPPNNGPVNQVILAQGPGGAPVPLNQAQLMGFLNNLNNPNAFNPNASNVVNGIP
jgi:hypothetical protein